MAMPKFIAVVTGHNTGGRVLGRAPASTKPLAASRAVRNALNNLMQAQEVYNDAFTSNVEEIGIVIYGQSSPAYQGQYDAMVDGGRYGVYGLKN